LTQSPMCAVQHDPLTSRLGALVGAVAEEGHDDGIESDLWFSRAPLPVPEREGGDA
jgi:hypothetical protein